MMMFCFKFCCFVAFEMATSFFYMQLLLVSSIFMSMATSFFYIYVMATSFFYIDIDIDIDLTLTN